MSNFHLIVIILKSTGMSTAVLISKEHVCNMFEWANTLKYDRQTAGQTKVIPVSACLCRQCKNMVENSTANVYPYNIWMIQFLKQLYFSKGCPIDSICSLLFGSKFDLIQKTPYIVYMLK